MYPVTQDFNDKMKATERRVYGKVQIDYTDPFLDQSIQCTANEQANISYPAQTADAVTEPFAKYAALDGSWVLGQDWALAPSPEEASTKQMGWWGSQLAGADGSFTVPYPTLTVTHFARPIYSLKVVGDSKRDEWPVDFRIDLYGPDNTLLYTEQVTGNTSVEWRKTLASPVLDVTKQVLTITKWSHPGRQVKILEFFTSIQETYEGDDILLIHLLEEREVSQGSLPVGNISANEIDIRLNNESRKFDAGNTRSPLYQLLKQNRRIKAWLGLKGDGDGMNVKQTVDFLQGTLNNLVVVNNKLQLPSVGSPSFSRNSIAYLSDGTQVAANQPRFEQGQFGQAVMVEEGTTNLNSDPFFKTGVSGWGVGTWTTLEWLSSEYNPFSKQNGVMRLYDNDGDKGHCLKVVSISNTPHTVSVLLKILKGNINNINVGGTIYYTDSTYTDYTWNDSNTTRYDMSAIFGQGVYKLVATITPNSSKTISKYEIRISHNNTVETELLVYAIQLEQKPYATSFINGTRYPETLTIPTASVLNPQEGTVEFWWMPINQPASTIVSQQTSPPIFEIGTYWQPNSLILWVYAGAGLRLLVRGNEATIWTGDWTIISGFNWYQLNCWYHIALRWQNGNTFYVFVNGVKYGPYVSSLPLTSIAGNIMSLGKLNASSGGSNALFDDLRISNRARTDEEILSAYQSNQPLPIDENTTYALRFDNSLKVGRGGYRLSKPIYLKSLGTCNGSNISWEANIPAGCDVKVYASVDGSTFQECENNAPIPSLSEGVSLVDKVLVIKEVLLTEDGVNIPELMAVRYNVDGTVTLRG